MKEILYNENPIILKGIKLDHIHHQKANALPPVLMLTPLALFRFLMDQKGSDFWDRDLSPDIIIMEVDHIYKFHREYEFITLKNPYDAQRLV